MFWDAWSRVQKTGIGQGWLRCSERIMGRYGVEARGAHSIIDINEQREGKKTNNGAQKKQTMSSTEYRIVAKKAQNINARNERKKKQIIHNCPQRKTNYKSGIHIKIPEHKRSKIRQGAIAENQEVTPRKTCNKQKVKSEGFGNKNQTSSAQKDCKK